MPVNISIKNAPDDLVAALKARAQRNHRSLQGEVLAILEEAALCPDRLTAGDVLAELRRLGFALSGELGEMTGRLREDALGLNSPRDPRRRERAIERAISLTRQGLPIGGRRFTRDEMHER
jgi:plasmid stability protein